MRQVLIAMKQGRRIGILIDQKSQSMCRSRFSGQPAMTSLAFIQLAKNSNVRSYPVRVERIDGVHSKVVFFRLWIFAKMTRPCSVKRMHILDELI